MTNVNVYVILMDYQYVSIYNFFILDHNIEEGKHSYWFLCRVISVNTCPYTCLNDKEIMSKYIMEQYDATFLYVLLETWPIRQNASSWKIKVRLSSKVIRNKRDS